MNNPFSHEGYRSNTDILWTIIIVLTSEVCLFQEENLYKIGTPSSDLVSLFQRCPLREVAQCLHVTRMFACDHLVFKIGSFLMLLTREAVIRQFILFELKMKNCCGLSSFSALIKAMMDVSTYWSGNLKYGLCILRDDTDNGHNQMLVWSI